MESWRRAAGLACLACVIILWTSSSFLSSSIFADDTYSKPYLVTYLNTAFFAFTLIPFFVRQRFSKIKAYNTIPQSYPGSRTSNEVIDEQPGQEFNLENEEHGRISESSRERFVDPAEELRVAASEQPPLSVYQTLVLSAKFCCFWFLANWFNSASFQYTSVASSTILTSTSSVFTLVFGALLRVEKFSIRKLGGVLASLGGIMIISYVDSHKHDDSHRGSFPYKTPAEIVIGDIMALASAMLYGVYATGLARAVGDESRVNMTLFFGFIGIISTVALWPVFGILHWTGFETFELPPDRQVWMVLLVNAVISLVSDVCWAYAVLLTSPLVVTVGLSLTIPLSLVGQVIINGQYASALYWVGAVVVILSFIFVNYESKPPPAPQANRDSND